MPKIVSRRPFVLLFGVLCLAGLIAFDLIAQSKNNEPPTVPGVPKPWTGTQSTLTSERPYVGPQVSMTRETPEASGSSVTRPTVQLRTDDPLGGNRASIQTGRSFGKDVYASRVSPPWADSYNLAMTSHSNGRMYNAYENTTGTQRYIEVNYSDDQGLTWKSSGWIWPSVSTTDAKNPSIAVTDTHIVVAYEVWESGATYPYVQVARAVLTAGLASFTPYSILSWGTNDYAQKPYVWSDLHSYPGSSSVYLVYEWLVNVPTNNINIDFQRSGDDGATWQNHNVLWGDFDSRDHRSPHGCWGDATSHYLYVVHYDATNKTIVMRRSTDWGVNFTADQNLVTVTTPPTYYQTVAPVIAASTKAGLGGVWVSYAASDGTDDDIKYLVTQNYGTSFVTGTHIAQTTAHEMGPWIVADAAGKYLHIVWTKSDWTLWYVTTDADFGTWQLGYPNGLQVNRGGEASATYFDKGIAPDWKFGFAGIGWIDKFYTAFYLPYFNRHVPDDLVGTWDGQGVYFRTDGGKWILLASPAEQVAAGDLDGAGDGTADLFGVWAGQGLMCKRSDTGAWVYLGTFPRDIAYGNMTGGAYGEVVGTWDSTGGVFYKTSLAGSWTQMATPADMITAGDLDGDGLDDLIGVWSAQAGVWVKYSSTGTWTFLGSTPTHIATGDMDGDGRADLVGTWAGQGVYWRKSQGGAWTYLGTPATLITTADMDGDGKSDIVGIWPTQAGVWTKYSSTNQWEYLSTALRDLSSGKMRAGAHTWGAQAGLLLEPVGGQAVGAVPIATEDYMANSPGMPGFTPTKQLNLVPVQDPMIQVVPGPGMRGFKYATTPNPVPIMRDKTAAKGGAEKGKY